MSLQYDVCISHVSTDHGQQYAIEVHSDCTPSARCLIDSLFKRNHCVFVIVDSIQFNCYIYFN